MRETASRKRAEQQSEAPVALHDNCEADRATSGSETGKLAFAEFILAPYMPALRIFIRELRPLITPARMWKKDGPCLPLEGAEASGAPVGHERSESEPDAVALAITSRRRSEGR